MERMMITGLKVPPAQPDRVDIYVNGRRLLQVRRELVLKAKLRVGQAVTGPTLDFLQAEEMQYAARDLALNHLARRPRTRLQMQAYLREKGYPEPVVQSVLQFLQQYGFLDDKRFALDYVRSRLASKPRSERMLRLELKQKGVPEEIVAEVFMENPIDDRESALALARARWKKTGRKEAGEWRKLAGYLYRKGYRMGTIREVMQILWKGSNLDND